MADGVFTLDMQGRISSWNKSMERISGYSAAQALGQSCGLIQCSRCFGTQCPSSIEKCKILERKNSEAKECFLRHKDGHDVAIIKNASVVTDGQDKIIGVVETITDVTELNKARQEAEAAALRLGEIHRLNNIIGKSTTMRSVFEAIRAAAASDATVVIQGESGTGKELVASAIHYNSDRKGRPFITVNCSALPVNLIESELFGHAKGAYTGASRNRIGRFEEATGGTVFLDEIAELSPFIQVKLLRVLQEREIERVGESRRRKIDVRILTATHKDLYAQVQAGHFREDLYYRLKVFPIHLPPLRERKEDVPILASHFIKLLNEKTGKNISGATGSAMRLFMDYPWPGNVRELENAIEHAFVLCTRDRLDVLDIPIEIRSEESASGGFTPAAPETPQQVKKKKLTKDLLLSLLKDCDWNKAAVGRRVGLSRPAIYKRMKKWQIPLANPDGD
ncbi:MAG: PAS domain-containing protein, partial [Desulfobacterales bacterium]|nr:PAS domain-containing protein [Desulfobacterales bacterium]